MKELGLRVDEMCMFPHIVSHGNVRLRWDCMKEVGVGLGLEGSEDVVANDSGYITNTALEPYAKTVDIPTKTSQLNNDSAYITANDVPVKSVDGATGNVVTNAVKTTAQTLTDAQKQQARFRRLRRSAEPFYRSPDR